MVPITSLLILIISLEVTGTPRPLFLYPHMWRDEWSSVQAGDLSCPPLYQEPNLDNMEEIDVELEKLSEHHEIDPVPGHLCHSLTYVTTCSVGFFGTQTITKKIETSGVTEHECWESVDSHELGEAKTPYFLAPSCSWMREESVEIKFVIAEPHDVIYNPYDSKFVDNLFPTGECVDSPCQTVHENTLWVSHHHSRGQCGSFETFYGSMFLDKKKQVFYLQGGEHEYYDGRGSCSMNYCGKRGVRFNTGEFIGVVIPPGLISECSNNITVSFRPVHAEVEDMREHLDMIQDRFECLNTLQRIESTGKASYLDLSKLMPHTVGFHYVIRINRNHLEKRLAEWKPLLKFSFGLPNQIGVSEFGVNIIWKEWVDSGINGTLSAFYGVHKLLTGEIIIPKLELAKMAYSKSISIEKEIVTVKHPSIRIAEQKGLDHPDVVLNEHHSVDIVGWVSQTWNSIAEKIGTLVLSAVCFIIGCIIIVKCPWKKTWKCCCCCGFIPCKYIKRIQRNRTNDTPLPLTQPITMQKKVQSKPKRYEGKTREVAPGVLDTSF